MQLENSLFTITSHFPLYMQFIDNVYVLSTVNSTYPFSQSIVRDNFGILMKCSDTLRCLHEEMGHCGNVRVHVPSLTSKQRDRSLVYNLKNLSAANFSANLRACSFPWLERGTFSCPASVTQAQITCAAVSYGPNGNCW